MIIKFSKADKLNISKGVAWDYPINKDIGVSYQKLQGRGPEKGMYLNKVCHEIYFIINGIATFTFNDTKYEEVNK